MRSNKVEKDECDNKRTFGGRRREQCLRNIWRHSYSDESFQHIHKQSSIGSKELPRCSFYWKVLTRNATFYTKGLT